MMSLVEWCKTVSGEIFFRIYYRLKWLINLIIFKLFLKYHHRHNQMLQFWCANDNGDAEYEEELIKVEATSIKISDISGNEEVARVDFMSIQLK